VIYATSVPALSSVVSQLFPLRIHLQMCFRKDLVSVPEAEDSHTTSTSPGVIAVSVVSLFTKLFVNETYLLAETRT